MKTYNIDNLTGGWFIGDFDETILRTQEFEVAYKTHYAGEYWAPHYHKLANEINYLISGTIEINGEQMTGPIIFVIEKNEVSVPIFITDVTLIVVKTPSVPGDKYETD